ncbi:MAG TPA: hypothetical protein PKD74_04295 [Candidatus Dependentiae bacterium]|jgi:hypothetical protein|nr:hypothetical protein [Candidatus Dependentiae bacterium]
MDMFKYVLMTVLCVFGSYITAQEPVVQTEQGKVQGPKVQGQEQVKAKANIQDAQQEVATSEGAVNPEDDFEEWLKGLDMSDDEISQVTADMNEEIAPKQDEGADVVKEDKDVDMLTTTTDQKAGMPEDIK